MTDFQADLFQLFGHTWPTITVQAQAVLFSNMGEQNHVFALTLADWAGSIGSIFVARAIWQSVEMLGKMSITYAVNRH